MAEFAIDAADGYPLAVTVDEPSGPAHATVLIAPAMGVTRRYYQAFSAWLARRGLRAVSFDLRGIGGSAPTTLKGFPATISDWIELDCAAAVAHAAALAGGRPLVWLGHSLGGQILPLVPNASRVDRMAMVASGNGYWALHDLPMKLRAGLLWHVVAPAVLTAAGYFPGRRLRIVGDLPADVMRQWRRWCLHPRYAASEPAYADAYASFRTSVASLSFTDDEFMSARNTDALHALYRNAPMRVTRIAPPEAGARRIGHFGCFRPEHEGTLWNGYLLPMLEA